MDGVLCDWHASCAALLGLKFPQDLDAGDYRIEHTFGVSVDRLRELCLDQQVRFWVDMPWTPFGRQLFELMKRLKRLGHVVGICTDASWTPYAPQGKHEWLHRHGFKDMGPRVLTREKWLLARPDTVLVDDSEDQVAMFRAHGGGAVLVPRLWNSGGEQPVWATLDYLTAELFKHAHGSFSN